MTVEILLLPLSAMGMVFITAPFAAFLLAGAFGWLNHKRKSKTLLLATLLWLIYGIYEYGMKLRLLCTGECNIRLDLFLIYPLLLCVSLLAVLAFVKAGKNA